MRICFVVSRFEGIGGIAAVVRQLKKKLEERGFKVDVLYGVPLKVRRLMNLSFAFKGFFDIKRFKADVYHAHGGFSMLPLLNVNGRKIVTIHGIWFKSMSFLYGGFIGGLAKIFENYCLSCMDVVTVVSREAKKIYCKFNPVYIPNGIDIDEFVEKVRNPVQLPDKSVLYIGRLSKEKGITVLLEAWKRVYKEIPSAKLYIIGSGELENLAKVYEKFNVKLIGEVSHEEVPNWLYNASLFVLPSLMETGMPMAILEAMALKIPVIASNIGGIPDIVIHGKTGFLVKPGSVNELAKMIISSLTSETRKIIENAYANLRENFNLNKIVEKYIKIYNNALPG